LAAGLIPAERQERITELIEEKGAVKVTELSDTFAVPVLTIRRDLSVLEERGILERSHGGAILRRKMNKEPSYSEKAKLLVKEKHFIAREATKLIEDGETVFVNSGSTNLQVLQALAGRKIRIITNNIGASDVFEHSEIEFLLTGGTYRPQSRSLVGSFSCSMLKNVFADKSIIGVDGFSLKYGGTTPIEQEAEVVRVMIEQTIGDVIVAADHKKIGIVSNFVSAPLSKIDYLVTDREACELIDKEELKGAKIKLVTAKANNGPGVRHGL